MLLGPALVAATGCGGGGASGSSSNPTLNVSPGTSSIDTNCTGCNATNAQGTSVEQFTATLTGGGAASVTWTVSGGDANSGPGTITAAGSTLRPVI